MNLPQQIQEYGLRWQLTNLVLINETPLSQIYSCDKDQFGPVVLKVLTKKGLSFEAGGFGLLATYNDDDGVKIVAYDQNAAVMEMLEGPPLLDLFDRGQADKALVVQIDLAMRLITTRDKPADLKPLNQFMASCMSRPLAKTPDFARDTVAKAQSEVLPILENHEGWTALHGDLHPRNILFHQDKWLAIDARGLMGRPAFEFANLFINPWDRPEIIFAENRMETIAVQAGGRLGCDPRIVIKCALLNCLFYADVQFLYGRGKYPVKCMEWLLRLLWGLQILMRAVGFLQPKRNQYDPRICASIR